MPVQSLSQIRSYFRAVGVQTAYVKWLPAKQDNEKNQVLLAYEPTGLATLFSGHVTVGTPSKSTKKKNSRPGAPKTIVELDFYWIDDEGRTFSAPNTKLIDYPQYPETRLSGFLLRSKWGPDAVRRRKLGKFGQRILVIGTNPEGKVYAMVLAAPVDPVVEDFPQLSPSGVSSVLSVLPISVETLESPAKILEQKIKKIISEGWHDSIRNKGGEIIPFKGNQGAGYTLEALLGVQTNALKEPDILGHEVKSYRGSKLSLMTPTADGGAEGDLTFREFMEKWGTDSKKDDGSIRFTGVVRAGQVSEARGFSLRVCGYDVETDTFAEPDQIRVELFEAETDEIVASWSMQKLAEAWSTKHAYAVYVPAEKHPEKGPDRYRFTGPFYMCEGTDPLRFLRAIASGDVYYDPAHTIYENGVAKVRPQWRVNTSRFEEKLAMLYKSVRVVD